MCTVSTWVYLDMSRVTHVHSVATSGLLAGVTLSKSLKSVRNSQS